MKEKRNKITIAIAALFLFAAVYGAYQFRREGTLTGTRWVATEGETTHDITFETGRKVVYTRSRSSGANPEAATTEGTYTCRGNHVEMHFPNFEIKGDAVHDLSGSDYLRLNIHIGDAAPVKIKAYAVPDQHIGRLYKKK